MATENQLHHRRSIRLVGYDYASEGGYFITVVTHLRKCLFGSIVNDEMNLNKFGTIVKEEWFKTAKLRPNIELFTEEFVVMPNHIHGIIWIKDDGGRGSIEPTITNGTIAVGAYSHTPLRSPSRTIGAIIRGLKGAVTVRINILRGEKRGLVWQRNYYEHIISSEKDYENIADYILFNSLTWQTDKEYTGN